MACWVERLGEATLSKDWLRIGEPEDRVVHSDPEAQLEIFSNLPPYLRQRKVLAYPVDDFHRTCAPLLRTTVYGPRSPSISGPYSPPDDGDSGPDGNPDRSCGFRAAHHGVPSPGWTGQSRRRPCRR